MSGMKGGPYDVIVGGAGFAGIYALFRMRKLRFKAKWLEAAAGVGGVWYWNRYPGCRCDVDTQYYQYGFPEVEEIQREWKWSERFATQPEIQRYMEFICERLDLYKDME